MDCKEEIIDMRKPAPNASSYKETAQLLFRLNHTMPMSEEYYSILKELFGDNIGEGSYIAPPLQMVCPEKVNIGKNVFINGNLLSMSRGGITIEDDVQIAGNVQLLSNNHDPYDRMLLTCKPVLIKKGAWIGAGATILPGVCVGRYAIVGVGSVVTRDVPDYNVAVGNPAKTVKVLDPERFE